MKNQYFGDINDYRKYGLLRALTDYGKLSSAICSIPPFNVTGQVPHFVDRWEIWSLYETVLLLAGDEAGTTTNHPGKYGVWRANGVVTKANEDLEDWIGRQVHENGEFIWVIHGVLPSHGWGTFRIN